MQEYGKDMMYHVPFLWSGHTSSHNRPVSRSQETFLVTGEWRLGLLSKLPHNYVRPALTQARGNVTSEPVR
jgi:hypothetical protein